MDHSLIDNFMNSPKKKVLIAGHTGFIGAHLMKKLKLDKYKTIIPISRSNGFNLVSSSKIFDIECDVIVNLSGVVGIDRSWEEPGIFYRDNYLTTLNLLELARKNNASIVHISSYVYGVPEYLPVDEKQVRDFLKDVLQDYECPQGKSAVDINLDDNSVVCK